MTDGSTVSSASLYGSGVRAWRGTGSDARGLDRLRHLDPEVGRLVVSRLGRAKMHLGIPITLDDSDVIDGVIDAAIRDLD